MGQLSENFSVKGTLSQFLQNQNTACEEEETVMRACRVKDFRRGQFSISLIYRKKF